MNIQDCLFCQIVQGERPATIVYQDDYVVVFDDIYPKAPIHKLIVPREHIATLNDVNRTHDELIGHMVQTAQKVAKDLGIDQNGYRVVINCNKDGGQVIYHLHAHLLGGEPLAF